MSHRSDYDGRRPEPPYPTEFDHLEPERLAYLERCAAAVEWVEKMQAASTVLIYTDNSRSWRVKWRPQTDGFEFFSLANSWLAAIEAAMKKENP